MLEFLSDNLLAAIRYVNCNLLYEMRVRANKPVVVNYNGKYTFLGARGITDRIGDALVSSYSEIESIIYRASEFSVYSVTDQLKQGFITGANGERIGLAGVYVYENGSAFTVKEVTSLNIRIPHEVKGAGGFIFEKCFSEKIASALILSPPGRGKTTILRDLSRLISAKYLINILINDERNEISAAYRDFSLETGAFSDIVRYAHKKDALSAAIRSMRPDLIITDELTSKEEAEAVVSCVRGGVEVIASAHFKDLDGVRNAPEFACIISGGIFDYYIVLDSEGIGRIKYICNGQFARIFEA